MVNKMILLVTNITFNEALWLAVTDYICFSPVSDSATCWKAVKTLLPNDPNLGLIREKMNKLSSDLQAGRIGQGRGVVGEKGRGMMGESISIIKNLVPGYMRRPAKTKWWIENCLLKWQFRYGIYLKYWAWAKLSIKRRSKWTILIIFNCKYL